MSSAEFQQQGQRRNWAVYGILLLAWVALGAWQLVEHMRVRETSRATLLGRGRDITTTLGLVIRSNRRFGSVFQDRIEPALEELVKTAEVESIHLLNKSGDVVASAGGALDGRALSLASSGEHWDSKSVTLVNLMDLGTHATVPGEDPPSPIIVLPRREPGATNGLGPPGPDPLRFSPWPSRSPDSSASGGDRPRETPPLLTRPRGSSERGFGRPPWMSEEHYQSLITKQGLHGFVVVMSTQSYRASCSQDLWMRSAMSVFGALAALGIGLAWRNMANSSELKLRLVRASELNNHLKEMNIAAAGLAHETRNPLNIVRGLAQMISKQQETSKEVRERAVAITQEVDRVTAQLNQFISYSKPREVKWSVVSFDRVAEEVIRALGADLEEKQVRLALQRSNLRIEVDEQMLRQTLFNLVINAIQALEPQQQIEISARSMDAAFALFEVRDTGPGVAEEDRLEIFKPYFTRRVDGTGLGLAVVQQICLAHGWDVECLPNAPRGAVFRISHVKTAPAA